MWERLRDHGLIFKGRSWLVGEDFNIFFSLYQRSRNIVDREREMVDFADVILDCQLLDPNFEGFCVHLGTKELTFAGET